MTPSPQQQQPGPQTVTGTDGTAYNFPPDATPQEIQEFIGRSSLQSKAKPQEQEGNLVDKIRPFIAGGVGALAAMGTALIPGVGESGVAEVAADTQAYAATDTLLKYLGKNKPKSFGEALTASEADAAVNAVAGKIIGGVFKGAKAVVKANAPEFYNLFPTTAQALEKYGMKKLATVSKFLEDYGVPTAKAEALDRSGGAGFTQALANANAMNGRMAGTNANPQKLYDAVKVQLELGLDHISDPTQGNFAVHKASQEALDLLANGSDHFKVLDDTIGNVDKLSKVLKVGQLSGSPAMNVKQDLAAYKFMDIINKATTKDAKGAIRLDPATLAEEWNNPKLTSSLELLYGKQGMQKVGDFFKDIAYTQGDQGLSPGAGKYLRYGTAAGRFILGIGALKSAISTGNFAPAAGVAGLQLTASTVGRLLTNPTTSRFISEMAKGTFKLNETTPFAARLIGNALRNQTVGLVSGDGSVTDGSLEENSKTGNLEFEPQR